jgi:periplasmic protein TonB
MRSQPSESAAARTTTVGREWDGLGQAVRRMHEEPAVGGAIYGENVVALSRPRASNPPVAAPDIKLAGDDRPARSRLHQEAHRRLGFVLFASLVAHIGLYAALTYQPTPTPGIAEEAITIEIVVGANSAAGIGAAPSNTEAERQASVETRRNSDTGSREDIRPEQRVTDARDMLTPQEPDREPPTQDLAAVVEEPMAQVRQQTPPPARKVDEPPPLESKPDDRPRPMPQASTASAPAANSVGHGRMAGDANYLGLVAARLARYKRFPPEARSRRQQGAAVVSFNINGDGRVASVRLVRRTGFAALDSEVEAMVHRASPFPAPPSGIATSFTAPVSFRLN